MGKLIRRLALENPSWGEERIAAELLLELGLVVSPRTIGRYMPRRGESPRGDQRWLTSVRNHARAIVATDLCTVVTARFQVLYVLVVMEVGSHRHRLPPESRVVSKPVLGGLHHEYRLVA